MKTKDQNRFVLNLLFGIGFSIVFGLILVAIGSKLVLIQKIGEGSVSLLAATILFLISAFGNILSSMLQGEGIIKITALHTVGLLCVVIAGALMIDGQFDNILLPVLFVLAGGIVSCVICMKKRRIRMNRKRRYR